MQSDSMPRQFIRSSPLVTAAVFWLFFQSANPLVVRRPKLEFPRHTSKGLGNNDNDNRIHNRNSSNGNIKKSSIDIDTDHGIYHNHHDCALLRDYFQPTILGRRQSIANIVALVAPGLWAFPEISYATSSSGTKNNQNSSSSSNKPRDRPIDSELSAAVQKLFDLDEPNRLVSGKDYVVDVQGRRKPSAEDDAAPDPLFQYVDPGVFEDRPTYKTFVALLDNYQPNVCLEEDSTGEETEEANAFLKACMATPVLRFCYSYCKSKLAEEQQQLGVPEQGTKTNLQNMYSFDTEEDFVRLLYTIWFQMYSRSKGCDNNGDNNRETIITDAGKDADETSKRSRKKVYGSSGFEHVFVGEIRKGKVIGFHNWIQLYKQEQAGNLDYRGTITKSSSSSSSSSTHKNDGRDRVLTYNLRWKGSEKPIGSSLIGVSPEFELALYTMVFLVGGSNDNVLLLDLGEKGESNDDRFLTKLDVKCFRTKGRVGSCYVESLVSR